MKKDRLFLDIRYYEVDKEESIWSQDIGKIYLLPSSLHALGARIARKLREYGFVAGEFDHLYISLSSVIQDYNIRFSIHKVDPRIQYVFVGLTPKNINSLTDIEKESVICSLTFDVLKFIAKDKDAELSIINKVIKDIETKGSDLEINHKSKETTNYSIIITYTILPFGQDSAVYVTYLDKKTGTHYKKEIIKLRDYEDVYSLIGSISFTNGLITLKPRESFKASLNTINYKVPIQIQVSELIKEN